MKDYAARVMLTNQLLFHFVSADSLVQKGVFHPASVRTRTQQQKNNVKGNNINKFSNFFLIILRQQLQIADFYLTYNEESRTCFGNKFPNRTKSNAKFIVYRYKFNDKAGFWTRWCDQQWHFRYGTSRSQIKISSPLGLLVQDGGCDRYCLVMVLGRLFITVVLVCCFGFLFYVSG